MSKVQYQFRTQIPATSANLGPGFDSMGIAFGLVNEMILTTHEAFGVDITGESASMLPTDRSNVVVQAIDRVIKEAGLSDVPEYHLALHNHIPVAGGLGSSASAIVGGLMLGNQLVAEFAPDKALSPYALLDLAIAIEGHPDNVTPAMFGGAWLCITDAGNTRTFRLPVPAALSFAVAIPNFPLPTEAARKVLPDVIPRADAAYNAAQAARLVLALTTGQLELLRGGFQDRLHEPYRKTLIPGYDDVRRAAIRSGALTVTLSGAGPSMVGWCESESVAMQAADEMTLAWRMYNVECVTDVFTVYLDTPEVTVTRRELA
ncbi:homoserine kinase [Alicyclobacillus curvatus]|jgi:homoserine kinase|nr:homoserine kinase [Alicyclobacillus curvatus]